VIRVSDNKPVFSAKAGETVANADTEEKLTILDFSAVTTPGEYCLDIPGLGRSAAFRVGEDVYNEPFRVAMGGMYLWRCGTAVSLTYRGQTFIHGACHLNDAFLDYVGGGHVRHESIKGWHDAGDFNKYVVNAGFTLGVMLQAWEQFGERIKTIALPIPEHGNGTPDFLSEIRWELDWLLTMQMEDGRVYHKLSTPRFCGFIMPEMETADRYFVPWSSAATADNVAVLAMASRNFAPYDADFSKRCLEAADKSYRYLAEHPEDHQADQKGFSTGGYPARDASRRLWAAVEMWQTTGDAKYLAEFESRAKKLANKVDRTCGWGNVTNLAMYTYLLSKREGRDADMVEGVRKDLFSTADQIVKTRDTHGYARPLGTGYYWGCNGDVAQQVQTLHVTNLLSPRQEYVDTSLDALGHLFGRNYYGRSFVTGLGANPPLHPHDRCSGADKLADPFPGYLVGGGWPKATDWQDKQENYRVNEIAINWNATLIYALADFIGGKANALK
jgi:endoglucanase